MIDLRYLWTTVTETLFRMAPFPTRTGLVRIGDPGRDAPVLLTGNFHLTVERVKRALTGIDAYLLVANSRGVNVWCAATGGLLTDHDVISVIKTSGIGELVDHRRIILPQLAATGVQGKNVSDKTGWRVIWGPVEAAAVPRFLDGDHRPTADMRAEMRTVGFPLSRRLEMAVAWAFPLSLLALVVLPFRRSAVLPLVAMVWVASLLVFGWFPLYRRLAGPRSTGLRAAVGRFGMLLVVWALVTSGRLGYVLAVGGELSWGTVLGWSIAGLVVVLVLGLDLTGSTPVYKSGLHQDRLLAISLDPELCTGAAFCRRVCPKRVFSIDHARRLAVIDRPDECVQCGACIVQCPRDALHFTGPDGQVVTPEVVRTYKLNLMGIRRTAPTS